MKPLKIAGRRIGPDEPPLVIAEIGINHEGDEDKARRMIEDAADAGCPCVKFQCHIVEDEMVRTDAGPDDVTHRVWDIVSRASFSEEQERRLKRHVESRGMIYLSTPFSRAAADRLNRMDVAAFKIGSGECNNTPLIRHVAGFGRPVILSTGMNDIASITASVDILRTAGLAFAIMHCTSIYPTPYDKVRLGALGDLAAAFPDVPIGLSDHSVGNYTCLAAVALGACLVEKHFTSDKAWPGPDIPVSIDPAQLRDLLEGTRAVFQARGGVKTVLPEEQPTIDFAYASVVAIDLISVGDRLTRDNTWVKRPGTGEIPAAEYENLLGRIARRRIAENEQIRRDDLCANESSFSPAPGLTTANSDR